LAHAHAVVACSTELQRRKSPRRQGRPIDLVPNAVDVAAYREPMPRPADLPPTSAVYMGTLHADRLDVTLCQATAQKLAGVGALVLVGPNALSPADDARLRASGVVLLGPRAHEEVIGYLQHADVLVVPHLVDEFTESLDPIKRYEYAAAGRPVVATAVAGFRDTDDPRVTTVGAAGFPEAVAASIQAPTPSVDAAGVPVPTWQHRAVAMKSVLDGLQKP
jgi:glycosyltransferase involved in cell wall biosynthesis